MSVTIRIDDEKSWLERRKGMLTASDAAVVLGLSPWKTIDDVYNVKTGLSEEKDISDKPYVIYGKKAEPLIRELFTLDFPSLKVDYRPYDIIQCSSIGYEWMGATLDGTFTTGEGKKGILEVKTGSFRGSDDLGKWDRQIPQYYYTQILHQLACMDEADFAIVAAHLKRDPWKESDDGMPEIISRYYRFDRHDEQTASDITYLMEREREFWKCVQQKRRPPLSLKF